MWREGLLTKVKQLGIRGQLYNYIKNFNEDRTFQVKVGKCFSSVKTQENGTPQGAVISPTLFNIAINDLSKAIKDKNIHISQFADDCAIWTTWKKITKKSPRALVSKLATTLGNQATNLINHLRSIGLKVNTKKTTDNPL